MSKATDRTTPEYWERRLFHGTYTFHGRRRQVSGWYVKLQWQNQRRTLRLQSSEHRSAAREAAALFLELRTAGWAAIDRYRAVRGRLPANAGGTVIASSVGPRKYVSDLNPGFTRELFVKLTFNGLSEHLALGTELPNEAQLRALEMQRELQREGWDRVRLTHSWEATIAVFWQANPMTCTYTTLLTIPARSGSPLPPPSRDRSKGWRLLIIEPDGGVRRALSHWLGRNPAIARIDGASTASELSADRKWDLIIANRDQPAATLRRILDQGGRIPPKLLTHGTFPDSDAIFASFSGVSQGYLLRRLTPVDLLTPFLGAFPEGPPPSNADADRQMRKYFQSMFDPSEARPDGRRTGLTARELEILDLLGRGFADKEIARDLRISVWTVHSHLKRIFSKYGVRTRTEAVVRHLQK